MANVQVENGHLKIADTLVVAICREEFTSVQFRILLSLMNMTYRAGKTKAEISNDDLRYATGVKAYKIQAAMGDLIDRKVVFVQHLVNGSRLVGLQKDYDQWLPKMGKPNSSLNVSNINKPPVRDLPKMGTTGRKSTPPGRILTWVLKELNIELGLGAWRKEYSKAIELYTEALEIAHTPQEALLAIRDYFDLVADTNFRSRVSMPISYMLKGFKQYTRSIPKKPRSIKEQEDVTGYRFRYNTKFNRWEATNAKVKPNH